MYMISQLNLRSLLVMSSILPLLSGSGYFHWSLLVILGSVCNYCGIRSDETTFRSLGNSSDVGDSGDVCQGLSGMESSDLRAWVIVSRLVEFFLQLMRYNYILRTIGLQSILSELNANWNSTPILTFCQFDTNVTKFRFRFQK